MAIKITRKSALKGPVWLYILLTIGIVLALGAAGSYLYFCQSGKKMTEEITDLDQQLKKTAEEKELENNLLAKEKRINDFKGLLSKHKKVINVFNFLQEKTHPQASFSSFQLDSKGQISLSGSTKSFENLGQQLLALKGESLLDDVTLSEVSMGQEGITFSLRLLLNPEIFK